MMQQPFPELAYLEFRTDEDVVSTLPDSFLGGSAPCLVVRFPALSKLLLSTPVLLYIPDSGYILLNTILICLSALANLEKPWIEFHLCETRLYCHLESRCPRRQKHTFLPVLRRSSFTGPRKYVEGLLNCIDAPSTRALGYKYLRRTHI
jgi:hypothetical protein